MKKAKIAYDTLKDDFERLKKIYEFDKERIDELNKYIVELEEINAELLEKKILAEAKVMKLEALKKKRDELFALNIHDLKNPINVIKGYATLINEYELNSNEQKEIMDSMIRSADKMMKVVAHLTEIIRQDIDDNKFTDDVSIRHIVDDICRNNAAYVKRKGINLINKTQLDLPTLRGNSEKIESVIDNLVNNAIKYGPEGTTVEILSDYDDESITLEVQDDGVGIEEDEQTIIFEKGGIASNVPTHNEEQSGLGLWIVKQVIEDHKGELWVKSEKGKGSTFGFKLPRNL